ncbi:MAG: hypothetical protein IJC48_03165 [Clostridia bacterium]|nr:hypothetical protein [Clostridia bacterium]
MLKYHRLLSLIMILILCMSLASCALLPAEEERKRAPVIKTAQKEEFKLSYVSRGDMALTKKISCTYVPIQKEGVSFQVNGEYIDEIYVEAGDTVQAGELMGQLRMDGVDEEIKSCEREIESLRLRKKHLAEDYDINVQRLAIVYSEDEEALSEALEQAEKSYEESLKSIEDTISLKTLTLSTLQDKKRKRQLIAPISGTVTYVRKYSENSVSNISERAITVADSTMSLFTAETEYWDRLNVGDQVTITVTRKDYEAVVADETALGLKKEERIKGEKALMYFTLVTPAMDLEDNDRGSFILTLDERHDVLRVSQKAISSANGETIVYVRDEEGMKSYKPVTLGLLADQYYEVIEGLTEGEEVIVQ